MASTPIWREIHATMKREIAEGLYRTGDRLPTEKDLAERFGVNRHTVRRALAELTAEGSIYVRRGSGAYVREGIICYRLNSVATFNETIEGLGRCPAQLVLAAETQAADDRVAERLELDANAPVVHLQTVGDVDGLRVVYARRWFPAARFPGVADAYRETGSAAAALARYGVAKLVRRWTLIAARAPSRHVAAVLGQPEIQPVLRAEGLNTDDAGRPVEFVLADWAGGRAQFRVED